MKIKYYILLTIIFLPQIVLAAPKASLKTSNDVINLGEPVIVTVTLEDVAAWNINIVGSGAGSCSKTEADVTNDAKNITKTITISCDTVNEGKMNIEVIGDITSEKEELQEVSLKKEVEVKKNSSSKDKEDTQDTPKEKIPDEPKDNQKDKIINTVLWALIILVVILIVISLFSGNKKKNNLSN